MAEGLDRRTGLGLPVRRLRAHKIALALLVELGEAVSKEVDRMEIEFTCDDYVSAAVHGYDGRLEG
ncbi:MAG: hypothetical protein QOG64_2247 [Acidimicrobiaceae bacterium]|nr:hypothetical protein [Acidimicrobiaceae bacterium]